jgi:hypothetical protein
MLKSNCNIYKSFEHNFSIQSTSIESGQMYFICPLMPYISEHLLIYLFWKHSVNIFFKYNTQDIKDEQNMASSSFMEFKI